MEESPPVGRFTGKRDCTLRVIERYEGVVYTDKSEFAVMHVGIQTLCVLLRVCQYCSSAKETQPQDIWDQGQAVAKRWQMSTLQPITGKYTRKQPKGSLENQSKTKVEKQQQKEHLK